ncbi:MAG: cupredoxin domain-containing protein [Chloroflexota bacterium]|nr:cupredoxin domain-containing protein [Chloroflexota bacterium]MBI5703335.1 cupredoxin domain-containing protein [Chloroflexota bacterium]
MAWILLGLLAAVVAFAPLPALSSPPQARTLRQGSAQAFEIDARQFAYSPSELKVNTGDTVTIQLVSADVVHGLYVDGYDVSVEADPGQSATLTFVADKPGSFRFRCNITCGAMHPFMIGKLTVGSNDWLYRSIGFSILAIIGILLFPRSTPITNYQLPPTDH